MPKGAMLPSSVLRQQLRRKRMPYVQLRPALRGKAELTDGLIEVSVFGGQGKRATVVGWPSIPQFNIFFSQSWGFGALRLHIMDANGHAGIDIPSSIST